MDSCHGPGVRDLRTGECSSPVLAEGTACSDGGACIVGGTCHAGACTGALDPVCAVIPGLDGVATVGNQKIAVFSYQNIAGETAQIPYGAQNNLATNGGVANPPESPPPSWFAPGTHSAAFTVPIDDGFVSWTVGQRTVTAFPTSSPTALPSGVPLVATNVEETASEQANDAILATLGQPPLGATAPGTVQGQFSVGDDGSGRYEVPLETPRGRNGVQPHLALVYNSRSGNGPLGPGWSIKGLSRIERCPRNPATAIDRQMETKPVTFDANDELCLDGELLIRQGDGSTGLGEYRTQRDNFARVLVASADDLGPLEFDVYRKDGLIEAYGGDAQSRLEATQQTPIATNDRAPIQMSSRTVRVAWGLGRVADRYGNAMTVTYKTKLSPEEGMGFTANLGLNPLRISYTSNDLTSRAATRFVDFVYDTALSDPQELYSAGVLTYRLLRLRSIAMSGPNPFTTAPLWSYQLTYLAPSITERQLLSRVTKCDPQNKCMAPIQFGWEAGSLNFNVTDSGIGDAYNASFNFGAVQSMETQSRMLEGFDVDGDGRDDLIYRLVIPQTTSKSFAEIDVNDAAWRVRVSNGSTFGPEIDPGISVTTTQQREAAFYPTAMPIDLNGDGRVDIAIYNTKFSADVGSPFDLYRATSGGNFVREPAGLSGTNFADPVQNPEYDRPGTMGNLVTLDLSGTGTPIIFRAIGRNIEGITPMRDTYAWRPYSSAGVVPYTLLNALLPGGGVVFEEIQMTGAPIVGDLDGDGKVEFLNIRQALPSFDFDFRYSAIGMSRSRVASQTLTTLPIDRSSYLLADTNGDGLPDALRWYDDGSGSGTVFVEQRRNLGTGFASGFPLDSAITQGRITDVDGDGRDDILVLKCANPNSTDTHPIAFLSRGEGFVRTELTDIPLALGIPVNPVSNRCLGTAMDVDGDGQLDIVQIEPGKQNIQIYTRKRSHPDHITYIQNGLGHTTLVEYGTIGNSSFDSCQFPRNCARKRMEAVTAYEITTGSTRAQEDRTRFTLSYGPPQMDALGRGWLGFSRRTITNTLTGATNTILFDNEREGTVYPHAGMPSSESSEVTLDSGRTIRRSRDVQFQTISGSPSTGGSYAVRPWVITEREDEHGVGQSYDFDHPQRLSETTLTFDGYGNLTNRVTKNEVAGRTDSYDATYDTDSQTWLISKIRTAHWSSVIDATGERKDRNDAYDIDLVYGTLKTQTIEPGGDADSTLTVTYGRDTEGQIRTITKTDPVGNARVDSILYDYVDGTYPRAVTNAAGHMTNVFYNGGMGLLMLSVDPNGVQQIWEYDNLGQLRLTFKPGANRAFFYHKTPNSQGMETDVTGVDLDFDSTIVDVLGRPIRRAVRRWDGRAALQVVEKTYDMVTGGLATVSRPFADGPNAVPAFLTSMTYDALGRPRSMTTDGQASTTIDYVGPKTTTSVGGVAKAYRITDELGQVVREVTLEPTSATGEIGTTFQYGPFGEMEHIIHDAETPTVTLIYDALGRIQSSDDPDQGLRQFKYNAFGELREMTDADDRVTSALRDSLGRVYQESTVGHVSSFVWDAAGYGIGQLESSTSGWGGAEVHYGYQPTSMLNGESWIINGVRYPVGKNVDALGRLTLLTYPPTGRSSPMTAELSYSEFDGSLNSVTWTRDAGGQSVSSVVWQKTDESSDGQIAGEVFGNGEGTLRHYDDATGKLRHIVTGRGAPVLGNSGFMEFESNVQNLVYTYQPDGQLLSQDDLQLGLHEGFTYDNVGRLKTWTPTSAATVTWDYSDIGNIKARHYQDQTGVTSDAIFDYAHPTKPHAITSAPWGTFSYDLSGRQTARPTQPILNYTTFDLPLEIDHSDGSMPTTFSYNAQHQRVTKSSSFGTTIYIGGMFERRIANGSMTDVFSLPGPNGQVVAQVQCSSTMFGESCGDPTYLHPDRHQSIDTISSADGSTTHFKRDPYGQVIDPSNPALFLDQLSNPVTLGFAGEEEDRDISLMNLNHRLYDPRTGRFISPDPLLFDVYWGQSYNRYAYALNNPMAFVDPSGLQAQDDGPPDPGCGDCGESPPEQVQGATLFPPEFIWSPPPASEALATPPSVDPVQEDPRTPSSATAIRSVDRQDPRTPSAVTMLAHLSPDGLGTPVVPAGGISGRTPPNPARVLAENDRDPLFGQNPFVHSYNEDGTPANRTIPILPIPGPFPNIGALEYGGGGVLRALVALFRFSSRERVIVQEATALLRSSQMAQLQAAYAKGVALTVTISGRLIQCEPNLPSSGFTAFGENGFLLGPEAFSQEGELAKTVLHELFRLSASNLSEVAQRLGSMQAAAAEETAQAFSFAERAYNAFFK